MTSRIFIGLSGPTFFDYGNAASKTRNDQHSSPNPILENALGLTVFYDEVWFICESFCPQTLRGHPKIRYLDRYLSHPERKEDALGVIAALTRPVEFESDSTYAICTKNFQDYWERVKGAGAYWWNDSGAAVDNHTHGVEILGVHSGGNSNRVATLLTDIAVCESLRGTVDLSLSLNSFTRNIYNALHPNQFDPLVDRNDIAICGSAVINALVPNCITPSGPHPDVFDRISTSEHASQFRRYIQSKQMGDAHSCYLDLVHEIEGSIAREVRRAANRLHPTRGLTSIVVESVHEALGTGLLAKLGNWYSGVISPQPIAAAAFVLDVRGGV